MSHAAKKTSEIKTNANGVGSGGLVRRFAVVRGYDGYGRPILASLHEERPTEMPIGMSVVTAQVRFAQNGNIRRWDVVPTWETHGCSTPGCGYADGKPCIRCGLIIPPNVEMRDAPGTHSQRHSEHENTKR